MKTKSSFIWVTAFLVIAVMTSCATSDWLFELWAEAEEIELKPAAAEPEEVSYGWDTSAYEWQGEIGRRITVTLPPGGAERTVWGDGVYTDDSSIGSAAVHAGLITFANGGTVTIEILEGREYYEGTTRNGITTRSYGWWGGSFAFVDKDGTYKVLAKEPLQISWSENALLWRGKIGELVQLYLPPQGEPNTVWGTDIYTDDSSIGSAAVHAGAITLVNGGTVTIEILGPQEKFTGTERNGIITNNYGSWPGSYRFK